MLLRVSLLLASCTALLASDDQLLSVPGDQLMDHLDTGKAVVLFSRSSGCSSCAAVAEELRTALPAMDGVRSYLVLNWADSHLYVDRLPALVLFIDRTPILYEGPMEGEAFVEFVSTTSEPRVVQLDDESFEHLTQASTGATTGDWLTLFYDSSCARCAALESRLQGAAVKLRSRVPVAKVNIETDGKELAKRFNIQTSPQILLFRQGRMYAYNSDAYDLASLSGFAVGLYKNAPSEPVPALPANPMVLVVEASVVIAVFIYMLAYFLGRKKGAEKKGI